MSQQLGLALCGCLSRIACWYSRDVASATLGAVLLAVGGATTSASALSRAECAPPHGRAGCAATKLSALVQGALGSTSSSRSPMFVGDVSLVTQHMCPFSGSNLPAHWTCSALHRNYSYPKLITRMLRTTAVAASPAQEISLPCAFWPGDDMMVYEAVVQWACIARTNPEGESDPGNARGLRVLALPLGCGSPDGGMRLRRRRAPLPHPAVVCDLLPRLLEIHGPASLQTLVVPPIQPRRAEAANPAQPRRRCRGSDGGEDLLGSRGASDVDQVAAMAAAMHHCQRLETLIFAGACSLPFVSWSGAPFGRSLHTLVFFPEGAGKFSMGQLAAAMPNLRRLTLLPGSAVSGSRWAMGLGRLLCQLEAFHMAGPPWDDDKCFSPTVLADWTADAGDPLLHCCQHLQTLDACPAVAARFAPRAAAASLRSLVVAFRRDVWLALPICATVRHLKLYEPEARSEDITAFVSAAGFFSELTQRFPTVRSLDVAECPAATLDAAPLEASEAGLDGEIQQSSTRCAAHLSVKILVCQKSTTLRVEASILSAKRRLSEAAAARVLFPTLRLLILRDDVQSGLHDSMCYAYAFSGPGVTTWTE